MKELKFYKCDFCETQYNDMSKALECEKGHKTRLEIASCKYHSLHVKPDGFPSMIRVKDKLSGEERVYKA